ncbi:MAG TPA: hypothetical protein VHX39_16900 [Acetobacteraceae bacterium]|nr:hypothetical protein [Acetobacteraceae bacterium]
MSDDFYDHRIKHLIKVLITRSEDHDESSRLKWEAVEPYGYELSLARSSLRIAADEEDGDWYPYIFSLRGESGNEIEEVYASSDSDDEFELHKLFKAASRSHRGASEKLAEVFRELGIADPPRVSESSSSTSAGRSGSKSQSEPPA